MSTIDTSTWSPDTDLNEAIAGIPLTADASVAQTWMAIRALMAALAGDGDTLATAVAYALGVAQGRILGPSASTDGHVAMFDGVTGGKLKDSGFTLGTSVPANAVFSDTTYATMTGASASAAGSAGLVPAPSVGDQNKMLKGDGTWAPLSSADIPGLDASKITSGTIDLVRLPAGALERVVPVANQAARYALTTASVQLGDTVQEQDTGLLYLVVDTTKLDSADGYVEYTAGSAASVPWSGVTGKPSSLSGYGIADASIANGVITLGANTITPLVLPSGVSNPERTVLCADGVWRDISQIAFPI